MVPSPLFSRQALRSEQTVPVYAA